MDYFTTLKKSNNGTSWTINPVQVDDKACLDLSADYTTVQSPSIYPLKSK